MIYESPAGWYVLALFAFILWVIFFKLSKIKLKKNLIMAIFVFAVSVCVEIIGIGLGLWSYTTGNWPWMLWPSYYIFGMLAYALFNTAERALFS
ncbi:MAG: hypothetical protein HY513_00085 [Candidatus Aenigmarchaeota archaeon]|nr:hypothetical protein [Candidatus Aenigmarchaeota archaeon]